MRRFPKKPLGNSAALLQLARPQPVTTVRLGKIQQNCVGFGENELAVNKRRNFSGWIDSQISWAKSLAAVDVDLVNFRFKTEVPADRQDFAAIGGKSRRVEFERYAFAP